MGRHTTRARRSKRPAAPSKFFIVALAIGLLVFIALFIKLISRPMTPPAPRKAAVERLWQEAPAPRTPAA